MPQVVFNKENQEAIVAVYIKLRNLLKSGQQAQAESLCPKDLLTRIWRDLLHYSMLRRNCPVTILTIKSAIRNKNLTRIELIEQISKIDQDVSREFSDRVISLIRSGKFDEEFARYSKVRSAVAAQLQSRIGHGLMNPNAFGKSTS